MIEDIKVPAIGENVASGSVVGVLVAVGDTVSVDDPLIELETDKAVVEIPSPVAGKLTELLVQSGDEVRVGDVIARVETAGGPGEAPAAEKEAQSAPDADARVSGEEVGSEPQAPEPAGEASGEGAPAETGDAGSKGRQPAAESETEKEDAAAEAQRPPAPTSPAVRRLARELGVDIHAVKGSGTRGRISEADVKAHAKAGLRPGTMAGADAAPDDLPLPDFSRWGRIETVALATVRRLTAEATATAWRAVPHVTQFDSADITALDPFVERNARAVEAAGGKLTITAILAKVCAAALKRFPRFNASIDMGGGQLILKHYIHIGVMVDTPRGLLVPVIRDADAKSITELAVAITDLAERARNRKVKPDELEGGTFSISNQGGIGGSAFTPIVLWPQVAVLGVSRSATEPRWTGGEFRPRKILPLSLSYDHRVVDGADAARFLRWVCDCLEHPFTLHLTAKTENSS
ncbi:MAG: 2-oxo acid dehydrogenase subunit E2 [Desulfobacteraceae bacterium]|jgi:pyruvate dehydrogenase E2 component (dihydrolipoamide acetyltransferase)